VRYICEIWQILKSTQSTKPSVPAPYPTSISSRWTSLDSQRNALVIASLGSRVVMDAMLWKDLLQHALTVYKFLVPLPNVTRPLYSYVFILLFQWFANRGLCCPHRTSGNLWRHLWWSQFRERVL
jgi:hypothetical protein